jgi:hypothetical protein
MNSRLEKRTSVGLTQCQPFCRPNWTARHMEENLRIFVTPPRFRGAVGKTVRCSLRIFDTLLIRRTFFPDLHRSCIGSLFAK